MVSGINTKMQDGAVFNALPIKSAADYVAHSTWCMEKLRPFNSTATLHYTLLWTVENTAGYTLFNISNFATCSQWHKYKQTSVATHQSYRSAPDGKSQVYRLEQWATTGRRTYSQRRPSHHRSSSISAYELRRHAGAPSGCTAVHTQMHAHVFNNNGSLLYLIYQSITSGYCQWMSNK